jgi:hypothetical protein
MTFLKGRRNRDNLRRTKTITTTTLNKPSPIVFGLIAAVVVSAGFIAGLAILAPQQLAEAAVTATDVICSGCVGTSDIADSAVTTAKIGSGQVGNSDLATDSVTTAKIGSGQVGNTDIADSAVTTAKIGSGQVGNGDIATNAVTTGKISDTNGVRSADIVDGEVQSADIGDSGITANDIAEGTIVGGNIKDETIMSQDIAPGAIQPVVHRVQGGGITAAPGEHKGTMTDCPPGEKVTGGGFVATTNNLRVSQEYPADDDSWVVDGVNEGTNTMQFFAIAFCIAPSP